MFTATLNFGCLILAILLGLFFYDHTDATGMINLKGDVLAGIFWGLAVMLAVNIWTLRKLALAIIEKQSKIIDLKTRLNTYYGAFSLDPNKKAD